MFDQKGEIDFGRTSLKLNVKKCLAAHLYDRGIQRNGRSGIFDSRLNYLHAFGFACHRRNKVGDCDVKRDKHC